MPNGDQVEVIVIDPVELVELELDPVELIEAEPEPQVVLVEL